MKEHSHSRTSLEADSPLLLSLSRSHIACSLFECVNPTFTHWYALSPEARIKKKRVSTHEAPEASGGTKTTSTAEAQGGCTVCSREPASQTSNALVQYS